MLLRLSNHYEMRYARDEKMTFEGRSPEWQLLSEKCLKLYEKYKKIIQSKVFKNILKDFKRLSCFLSIIISKIIIIFSRKLYRVSPTIFPRLQSNLKNIFLNWRKVNRHAPHACKELIKHNVRIFQKYSFKKMTHCH